MITITDDAVEQIRQMQGEIECLRDDLKIRDQAQNDLLNNNMTLAAENYRLSEQLVSAQQTLKEIAAGARFEQEHPSELRDTAFYLIEKKARAHLTDDLGEK